MATLSREDSTRPLNQDAIEAEASANRVSDSSSSDGLRNRLSDSSVKDVVPREWFQRSRPRVNPPPVKNFTWKYAVGASIVCLFLGFAIGVTTDAAVYVDKGKRLTEGKEEVVKVVLHVLSLFAAAVGGRIADKIGRLPMIEWMGFLLAGGSLIVGLFSSNASLLLGRASIHVAAGFGPMMATTYIAEIAPVFSRGWMASLPEALINLGTLLGLCFNYAAFKLDPMYGRFALIGMGVATLALLRFGIRVIPESPRWLLMHGNVLGATSVLARTSVSREEADSRLNDMMTAFGIPVEPRLNFVQVKKPSCVWRELLLSKSKPVLHMTTCAIGLNVLQQLSGLDTILLFSSAIIKEAGVESFTEKLIIAIKFQTIKTVISGIIPFLLEWVGRKTLLLISISGMTVSLAALGTCLCRIEQGDMEPKWPVSICVPSLYSYVALFSVGMGPVAPLYTSEVFPTRLRAQGYALAVATNQLTSVILAATFQQLYEWVTLGGAVLLFMGMALLGILFVYLVLPETQGKTLEDVHKSFGTLVKWRRSAAATGEVQMQTR